MSLGRPVHGGDETHPDSGEKDSGDTKNSRSRGRARRFLSDVHQADGDIEREDSTVTPLWLLGFVSHGRNTRYVRGSGAEQRLCGRFRTLIRTSVHLGVARLVPLDPFGGKAVMIGFAVVVVEDSSDRLIGSCGPYHPNQSLRSTTRRYARSQDEHMNIPCHANSSYIKCLSGFCTARPMSWGYYLHYRLQTGCVQGYLSRLPSLFHPCCRCSTNARYSHSLR